MDIVNYYGKFIKNLAAIAAPMYGLLKKEPGSTAVKNKVHQ